jgi:pseudouridine synthase
MESEGLILVTNDGDLANSLTHPSHHVEKEYEVTLDKPFQIEHREKMLRGIRIESGLARAVEVQALPYNRLRVILQQGLKRQIRHMCYHLGYEVLKLLRIRIGTIQLGALKSAHWRPLSPAEISSLKRATPTLPGRSEPAEPVHRLPSRPKAPTKKRAPSSPPREAAPGQKPSSKQREKFGSQSGKRPSPRSGTQKSRASRPKIN